MPTRETAVLETVRLYLEGTVAAIIMVMLGVIAGLPTLVLSGDLRVALLVAAVTFMLTGLWEILVRHSVEAIPGGRPVIWILCAAALVPFYRLAERYFLRIESMPGDDRHGGLIGGSV